LRPKPQFIRSVIKGYARGTLSNNGRKQQRAVPATRAPEPAAISDD
jgi:hypothetical protein